MVVFEQGGCFGEKWLNSGKSCFNRTKMVVFEQSGCIRSEVILLGQSGCIRA